MPLGSMATRASRAAPSRLEEVNMRQDINHRVVFEKPDRLGDDLALLFEAVADAFRGMASASRLESRWSRLRYCGDSF
jgi:hypothetical protein